MTMGRKHASPYYPDNGALRKVRARHERREVRRRLKGTVMRTRTQIIAGAGMLAAGIVLAVSVSADGGQPEKAGYSSGCEVWLAGYSCDGSPVATPEPVVTPTATLAPVETVVIDDVSPTPTSEIDGITVLPATGVGPGR